MGYSEALEQQVKMLRTYVLAERSERLISEIPRRAGCTEDQSKQWVEAVLEPLVNGETFYWSTDLCSVLERSAQQLEDWTVDPTILISKTGFAWFSRPLTLFGEGTKIRAMGWMCSRGVDQPLENGNPDIAVVFYLQYEIDGVTMPAALIPLRVGLRLREQTQAYATLIDMPGMEHPRTMLKAKYFAVSSILLAQRVFVASQRRAERHAVKRLDRGGWTHEPLIRVVELRRRANHQHKPDDHRLIEWSHQWVVSGHWRQQPYPSLGIVQPKWIMPYVKGPDDAPLKPPRAKVFAVVR